VTEGLEKGGKRQGMGCGEQKKKRGLDKNQGKKEKQGQGETTDKRVNVGR